MVKAAECIGPHCIMIKPGADLINEVQIEILQDFRTFQIVSCKACQVCDDLHVIIQQHPRKREQSFLTMLVSDVKKTWCDDDEFNKECGSLAALLDPLIKSLASETSQLVNMHASRSK